MRPDQGVYQRAVQRYVALCQRRGVWLLLLALALAAAGVALAPGIRVDARLEALLPAQTPSQRSLAELRRRAGSISPLYLVVQSPDPALNRRLSRSLREAVGRWPETRQVLNRRDPTYFLQRRLLFLPAAAIDDLTRQVQQRLSWEECRAAPGCENLEVRPPRPDLEAFQRRYTEDPTVRALLSLVGAKRAPSPGAPRRGRGGHRIGELCAADGSICVVQADLKGQPSNLAYATRIMEKAQRLFGAVRPTPAPAGLRLELSGGYRNAPMVKRSVMADLRRVVLLSSVLVLLVLVLQFRGPRSLLLLLLPLGVGGAWTAGVIALLHPTLNMISAFTLAILAGLGVDFGVHLLTHYGHARSAGAAPAAAVSATLARLGPSMLVAAMTTGCGFAALAAANFRGFAELGALAALGIGMTLLATALIFPPLALLCHRLWPERVAVTRSWPAPRWLRRGSGRFAAAVVLGAGLTLVAAGALLGPGVSFEYNFRKIRPPSVGHGIPWGKAMHGTTRTPIFMLADTPEALTRAAAGIRGHKVEGVMPWIITPRSFIPADQPQRLAAVRRLRRVVDRLARRADQKLQRDLQRWRPLLAVERPITAAALPRWVRQAFAERDGRVGHLGLIYLGLSGADARQMERLSVQLDHWRTRFPQVRFASPVALLGEVIPGLRRDAPLLLGLALLGLLLGTILIGRSLRRTALVLAPVVVAAAGTLAGMVLLGFKINMYNMMVFPLAFGIGVDGAIYLVWARARVGAAADLSTAGRAVVGSTLTTMAGFGSLAISVNPGLASLGLLALLALSMTLLANLVWLPCLLRRWG